MINKLKSLFLIMSCAAFFVAAHEVAAQKASGADVAGMIEFYEWAFETDFSLAQKSQFRQFLEKDFRDDAATARKNTNTILETFAEIKQADAETRRETRRVFLETFLSDLKKKESSEADAKFLLGVYRAAHGGSDEFTALNAATGDVFDQRADKTTTAGGAANIYGKWTRSIGSGNVDYTGKTTYRSGETFTFEFMPDGTMNYLYDKDVLAITQCKIKETGRASGTIEISGDTLTMNLGALISVGSSTCDKKDNFRRTLTASTLIKKFTVKKLESLFRPDAPLILCFDGQKDEDCFEKSR